MSVIYDNPTWTDGDFSVAAPVGLPLFDSPIPFSTEAFTMTQDFMQRLDQWEPLDLNTPHDDYPDFLLVLEGQRRDLGGGIVQWTRTYARVPNSYDLFGSKNYRFVGYSGYLYASLGSDPSVSPGTPYGREPFTKTVACRIQHDFFLISDTVPNPIDNVIYKTPGDIPAVLAMRYSFVTVNIVADYLTDNPPFAVQSIPGRTIYATWTNNALVSRWKSDVAVITIDSSGVPTVTTKGGQIPIEDSTIEPWMGNIWVRRTPFVLAE